MRPLGDQSTPTAKNIRKALEVYTEHEESFNFVGWELAHILDNLTRSRLERIIEGYRRETR